MLWAFITCSWVNFTTLCTEHQQHFSQLCVRRLFWQIHFSVQGHYHHCQPELYYGRLKANSHIACCAHAVPLPCCASKGLECVFPIWFTQCDRVWFTCHAVLPRPRHSMAVKRQPVDHLAAFGFFQLLRRVPRTLLSDSYQSQMQVASVKPNTVCHGRGKEW